MVRVLLVEDSLLLGEVVKDHLSEVGCEVIGPAGDLEEALRLARSEALDLAVLDIRLGDDESFGVAEALAARGIPFLFLSGYDAQDALPQHLADRPVIGKPFRTEELSTAIQGLLKQKVE